MIIIYRIISVVICRYLDIDCWLEGYPSMAPATDQGLERWTERWSIGVPRNLPVAMVGMHLLIVSAIISWVLVAYGSIMHQEELFAQAWNVIEDHCSHCSLSATVTMIFAWTRHHKPQQGTSPMVGVFLIPRPLNPAFHSRCHRATAVDCDAVSVPQNWWVRLIREVMFLVQGCGIQQKKKIDLGNQTSFNSKCLTVKPRGFLGAAWKAPWMFAWTVKAGFMTHDGPIWLINFVRETPRFVAVCYSWTVDTPVKLVEHIHKFYSLYISI